MPDELDSRGHQRTGRGGIDVSVISAKPFLRVDSKTLEFRVLKRIL